MNDILYIIDYVNYNGGAHVSAAAQIRVLIAAGRHVTIFSLDEPDNAARERFSGCTFRRHPETAKCRVFATPLKKVLADSSFPLKEKLLKLRLALSLRLRGVHRTFERYIGTRKLDDWFSSFRYLCVLSEGSALRRAAARCTLPFKIQWIHLDYEAWANDSAMAARTVAEDRELFDHFDWIVFISRNSRDGFLRLHPDFPDKERLAVIYNLMPDRLSALRTARPPELHSPLRFVTIARLDRQKNIRRCIRIAARLRDGGYDFQWSFIGDGRERKSLTRQIRKRKLEQMVFLEGFLPEPWKKGREADAFVLFSKFEGIPNVIFEAFLVGIPVVANAIAAIPEQIDNGVNGFLVDNNENAMYLALKEILDSPEQLKKCKEQLAGYRYDNVTIENQIITLFSARLFSEG